MFLRLEKLFRRGRRREVSTATRSALRTYGSAVWVSSAGQGMNVATVYRCVSLLSDSVASLHMRHLVRRDGRFVERDGDNMAYLLGVQPQPERSIFDFWHHAVQQMLLTGNAYIYPRRIGGRVVDLVLCSDNCVSHDAINNTYSISDTVNGVYGTYCECEIIHLFLHSSDGRNGISVLSHAARTIGIASVGDEETANRFSNGGSVRGIVGNDHTTTGFGEYQDEQLEAAAANIDERFQRGEKIVSIPGDVSFKQISLSSTDMQFLESRKFTVLEICRFFGVHPSFVFADTASNYKSAEMANIAFLSMTLDPILKRIEAEFNRKLVGSSGYGKELYSFDRRGIYSLDLSTLADYQKKTIETGIYTVNDWRKMENQPIVDGGDSVLVSANLKTIKEILEDKKQA